eukprot:s5094_g3.t1
MEHPLSPEPICLNAADRLLFRPGATCNASDEAGLDPASVVAPIQVDASGAWASVPVQQLRSRLAACEAEAELPAADVLDAAEQAPPELAQKAADLAARAAALKRSEQALDAKRAEVRAATEEASLFEREAASRRSHCSGPGRSLLT